MKMAAQTQLLIQAVSELPTARMWEGMTEKCHFTNSLYTSLGIHYCPCYRQDSELDGSFETNCQFLIFFFLFIYMSTIHREKYALRSWLIK